MKLTGIEWLDIIIVLLIASGLLTVGWKWVVSHSNVQKAMENHGWLKTLEPILGAAINKAEVWGKENNEKGALKLERATDIVKKGMTAIGAPKNLIDNELIESLIESKLTGGSLEDIASSILRK